MQDAGENAIAQPETQAPEVTTPEVTPPETQESPQENQPKPEEKRPTGYDRVKAKLAAKEAELQAAQQRAAELEARIPRETPKGKPDPKDYEDKTWGDYAADLAKFEANEAVKQTLTERDTKAKEEALRGEAAKRQKDYQAKAAEFAKSAPDFHEVTDTYDGPWNNTIAQALIESDMGPQVAYYLAKNPEEADKLDGMNYGQVARYFGRIEAKLESPAPKEVRTTQAPPPIKPVGGSAKGTYDPYSSKGDDHDAYLRWRHTQNL